MPENYRRPSWHEANLRIERMFAKRRAERDAMATVRRFNAKLSAGRAVWFWPKVGAALTAKCPWLYVLCEGCGTIIDLDLSMKPRDPEASIRAALKDVHCNRCYGHSRTRIVGLSSRPSV